MSNEDFQSLITGISAGALDPNSQQAEEHAVRYYGLVRSMKTDCKRIAANTGFREKDIQRVKNHIFYEEHNFGDGDFGRFDESYEIARSWQRLIDGREIEERDIVLLNHEFLESIFMAEGLIYSDAHTKTSVLYDYSKFILRK